MISPRTLSAALLGSALVGAGAGAGIYASTGTHRTVTVAAPAAASASQVAQTSSTQPVGQIYRKAGDGVVEIVASSSGGSSSPFPYGGSGSQAAEGSGFVYDDKGDIVTNQHVIGGADSVSVKLADGSTYKATVVGSDASTDLAVVKIDAPAFALHPLQLADSSKLSVGDGVVAIGSPFGLQGSVTSGIVSALHREINAPDNSPIEDAIQTDAAINHGNSGGPLLDTAGRVVGINSQIKSDSGGSDGIGFAVPVGTVRSVVAQLLARGTAAHAFLGVRLETVTPAAATELDLPEGVQLSEVETDTPASRAGLRAGGSTRTVDGHDLSTDGDVVVSVDGKRIRTAEHLQALVAAKKPGDRITLGVVRKGKERTITVTLGTRPS
jgi:S1-C subfamily serine protease